MAWLIQTVIYLWIIVSPPRISDFLIVVSSIIFVVAFFACCDVIVRKLSEKNHININVILVKKRHLGYQNILEYKYTTMFCSVFSLLSQIVPCVDINALKALSVHTRP